MLESFKKRIISNHEFDEIRYHFYVIWIEYSVFTNASFEEQFTYHEIFNIFCQNLSHINKNPVLSIDVSIYVVICIS